MASTKRMARKFACALARMNEKAVDASPYFMSAIQMPQIIGRTLSLSFWAASYALVYKASNLGADLSICMQQPGAVTNYLPWI